MIIIQIGKQIYPVKDSAERGMVSQNIDFKILFGIPNKFQKNK